jgi:hypothetical protein
MNNEGMDIEKEEGTPELPVPPVQLPVPPVQLPVPQEPLPVPPPVTGPLPPPVPQECKQIKPIEYIKKKLNDPESCNNFFYFIKKQSKEIKSIECYEDDDKKIVIIRNMITGEIDGEYIDSSCELEEYLNKYDEIKKITKDEYIKKYEKYYLYKNNYSPFHVQADEFHELRFSDNYFDRIDDIFSTINDSLKIYETIKETPIKEEKKLEEMKVDPPTRLEEFIKTIEDEEKKNLIKDVIYFYSLIRSYIDFYHDFVSPSIEQIKEIRNKLEGSNIFSKLKTLQFGEQPIINIFDEIDNAVITSTRDGINQTQCKKKIKEYMEKYCKMMNKLGVYWLTPNKESAFMCSANTQNSLEMDIFLKQLNDDYIDCFYTETDKSHISEFLAIKGFNMLASKTGEWDAGPGFSEKTYKRYNNKDVKKILRKYDEKGKNSVELDNNNYIITNNENSLISQYMFLDLFKIYANNVGNENKLIIEENGNKVEIPRDKGNATALSVNALSATVGIPQSRGEKSASAITGLQNKGLSKQSILSLKTFGDFIQLLDIHDIKEKEKCIFIVLDQLCEDSGMLFGLPTIRSESKFVSYYCYDTRYHSIDPVIMQRKLNVFLRIANNVEILKIQVKEKIFKPLKEYLENIQRLHYDPSIYYAANYLLYEIEEIKNSAIQKLDEVRNKYNELNLAEQTVITDVNYIKLFPINNDKFEEWNKKGGNIEKLKEFNGDFDTYMEQICDFSRIKGTFMNISNLFTELMTDINENVKNRIDSEQFKNYYYKFKQELINFLNKDTQPEIINLNFIVIFAVIFSTKGKYAQDSFILNINELLSKMRIEKENENDEIEKKKIENDMENLKKIHLFILLINILFEKRENIKVKNEDEDRKNKLEDKALEILKEKEEIEQEHLQKLQEIIELENKYNESLSEKLKKEGQELDNELTILHNKGQELDNELTILHNKIEELEENYKNVIIERNILLKKISEEEPKINIYSIEYIKDYFKEEQYINYYQQYTIIENSYDEQKKISFFALPYNLIYNILIKVIEVINKEGEKYNIDEILQNKESQIDILNKVLDIIPIIGIKRRIGGNKKRNKSKNIMTKKRKQMNNKTKKSKKTKKNMTKRKKQMNNKTKKSKKTKK